MADFAARKNFNSGFTGLITTSVIFAVIGATCLVGFETLRQLKRLPHVHFRGFHRGEAEDVEYDKERRKARRLLTRSKWKGGSPAHDTEEEGDDADSKAVVTSGRAANKLKYKQGLGTTPEDWEMGHLYMARQFHASTPSPPLAKWPLMWAWQALRFDDWFYATHTGMDTVVYVRFLRGCCEFEASFSLRYAFMLTSLRIYFTVWWMFLQTFTTAPILLGVHFKFSTGVPLTDMSRASLTYLVSKPEDVNCPINNPSASDCARVPNAAGRRLLWIHLCLMIYISTTWIFTLWWIGRGSVIIRRRLVERVREKTLRMIGKTRKRDRKAAKSSAAARAIEGLPATGGVEDTTEFGGILHAAAHHSIFSKKRRTSKKEGVLSDSEEEENVSGSDADEQAPPNGNEPGRPKVSFPADVADHADKHGKKHKKGKFDPSSAGWRQRTLIVTNMPSTMRDEASVRRYFEEFLRPDEDEIRSAHGDGAEMVDLLKLEEEKQKQRTRTEGDHLDARQEGPLELKQAHEIGTLRPADLKGHSHLQGQSDADGEPYSEANSPNEEITAPPAIGPEPDLHQPFRHLQSPIQTVVLVRKMTELSAMLQRRQDVLQQLEAAHIKLAQNVLKAVGVQIKQNRKDVKKRVKKMQKSAKSNQRSSTVQLPEEGRPAEYEGTDDGSEERTWTEEEGREELRRRLSHFLPSKGSRQGEKQTGTTQETIWEALASAPRELLDPYQPVTRLSALFRGQTVPTVDYLLTKLNLLTALVTEMRARPPSSYEPTSTAFVTFRDPRQARMVWRELDSQIVIKVRPAPEVKDLDWERLMRTTFTGDIIRGFSVNAFFWAFTIFWTIPIQLVATALFSVQNLKTVFPPVTNFLEKNPGFESFISITAPTIFVSLVTMTVPELIFQISRRAQGFVTWSALYDQCMCRYWKFIICNVVIFFCIGTTTIESILTQIGNPFGTTLDAIASAFPTAAPFFVSYLILCMATHSGLELLQAIVGLIQHLGSRNAFTPRARAIKSLPRNFTRYYWLPFHMLIMTIVFIFAVLNPLVIPFAMLYLWLAM